jgi:hypothetical protein
MTLIPRPKRIFPLAPPGSLLKRATVPTTTARSSDDGDADYLRLVRALPCLYCGMEPSESAHVRFSSAAFGKASGLGKKPENRFCVPLCAEHHRLAKDAQHNRGEREFWESLGINPLIAASSLWEARGDLVRMVSVAHVIIAGRDKRP